MRFVRALAAFPLNCNLSCRISARFLRQISLVSPNVLGKFEARLRILTGSSLPWGGLHMLFLGDFFQLPPVQASNLWSVAAPGADEFLVRGLQAWTQVTEVYWLTEQMRARESLPFAEFLLRLRMGQPTEDDVATINQRVVSAEEAAEQLAALWSEGVIAPFLTGDNVTRRLINASIINSIATDFDAGVSPICPVRITMRVQSRGRDVPLDDPFVEAVKRRDEQGSSESNARAPFYLDVFPGMPVSLTENVATHLGLANGSWARVVDVQWPPGTRFRLARVEGDALRLIPTTNVQPDCIVVALVDKELPNPLPFVEGDDRAGQLPANYVYLTPFKKDASVVIDGQNRSCTTLQFPFVPGFAITVHRAQGQTFAKICIVDWDLPSTYVALSRVGSFERVLLLQPATMRALSRSLPAKLLAENARLYGLATLALRDLRRRCANLPEWLEMLPSELPRLSDPRPSATGTPVRCV